MSDRMRKLWEHAEEHGLPTLHRWTDDPICPRGQERALEPGPKEIGGDGVGVLTRTLDQVLCLITGQGEGDAIVDKVNISDKLALFHDHWSPRIVGELNGQHVKLIKFQGEFVWHKHDHEDELFLVVKGRFKMEFRDYHVWLEEGEFLIVPRGVEHRPVAEEEVHVLLFEPIGTLNTGDVKNQRTVEDPKGNPGLLRWRGDRLAVSERPCSRSPRTLSPKA
jgi:mannose-6-phosphate isomerase-like protein (cupin superfamily)